MNRGGGLRSMGSQRGRQDWVTDSAARRLLPGPRFLHFQKASWTRPGFPKTWVYAVKASWWVEGFASTSRAGCRASRVSQTLPPFLRRAVGKAGGVWLPPAALTGSSELGLMNSSPLTDSLAAAARRSRRGRGPLRPSRAAQNQPASTGAVQLSGD